MHRSGCFTLANMHARSYPASIELGRVMAEAHDIAEKSGQSLTSVHLLLSLFTVDTRARTVLEDGGLDVDEILDVVLDEELEAEPIDSVPVINAKAAKLAESNGDEVIGSLHLVLALCRVTQSLAYRVMSVAGKNPADVRSAAHRALTGRKPRSYRFRTAIPHADRIEPKGGSTTTTFAEPKPTHIAATARLGLGLPEPNFDQLSTLTQELRKPPQVEQELPSLPNEEAVGSRFTLDSDIFPILTSLGRNLTVLAERKQLDPLIGREQEVEQLVDILNKRRANNPCLVGDPGVGKTAIIEGLAQLIVQGGASVGALGQKVVVELEMGSILAGTQLRGAFSERLAQLKDEMAQAGGRIILFIDEIHTLIGAGAGDGPLDAANELKTALARGEFPCIGSTTEREYRKHFESDPSLERRFQLVLVDPPSAEEALQVLDGLRTFYEEHHRVKYRQDALTAAVRLSDRWIHDKFL
ncbi:MAG TPA: AAA family ATPase, partial [Myxococcales bacterium]|nr:AAA family ATPase [Myxococcales bacterium]